MRFGDQQGKHDLRQTRCSSTFSPPSTIHIRKTSSSPGHNSCRTDPQPRQTVPRSTQGGVCVRPCPHHKRRRKDIVCLLPRPTSPRIAHLQSCASAVIPAQADCCHGFPSCAHQATSTGPAPAVGRTRTIRNRPLPQLHHRPARLQYRPFVRSRPLRIPMLATAALAVASMPQHLRFPMRPFNNKQYCNRKQGGVGGR